MDIRDEFIKQELIRRVNALKLLGDNFDVDGINFPSRHGVDYLVIIGDIDRLAKLVNCEVYDSEDGNGKLIRAFELYGIEIRTYVF